MTRLYTPGEVAKLFRVAMSTVYRWMDNGDLKFIRIKKTLRIPYSEIERLFNQANRGE